MRPIVTDQAVWSVSPSVTLVRPAKTAEPIEMSFGLRLGWAQGIPVWYLSDKKCVLDRGRDPPLEGEILRRNGRPIVKYRGHSAVTCVKIAEPIVILFGLWARTGLRHHKLDGSPDPPWKGQFWGKGAPIVKYRDFLPWAVQKRLNRSICHLGCGLGWTEWSTNSIVFARWRLKSRRIRQVAPMCPRERLGEHIGATWRIRLNRLYAAAMRPYVKLLWPLVIIQLLRVMGIKHCIVNQYLQVFRVFTA